MSDIVERLREDRPVKSDRLEAADLIERQREALRQARDALVDAQQTIAEIGLSDIAQEEALAAIDAVLGEEPKK